MEEHPAETLAKWLQGELDFKITYAEQFLDALLADSRVPKAAINFFSTEMDKKKKQDLAFAAGLGEPYVAPANTHQIVRGTLKAVGVSPTVSQAAGKSPAVAPTVGESPASIPVAGKQPAALAKKENKMSTLSAAKYCLVAGAKHGASYVVGKQILKVVGESVPLPAGFEALPEEVRVFLACAAARAIGAKFNQGTVVTVADHGMEGASTLLFAKVDLQTIFNRISAIAPGES